MRVSLAEIIPALEKKQTRVFVLYGNQPVLQQGIVQEINSCFSYETISSENLPTYRNDLDIPLLFGKKPDVVHVEGPVPWNTTIPILQSWPKHHAIIVHAGASFPAMYTKLPDIAAVACYECSQDESRRIVKRYAVRNQLNLETDALEWCAAITAPGHWHSVMSVISLVGGSEKTISLKDIFPLFPDFTSEDALAILDCKKDVFYLKYIEDPVKMIRSWQRMMVHLWQLKQILPSCLREEAFERIKPAVFFKHKEPLLRACSLWSKMKIIRCLGELIQAEISIKKEPLSAIDVLQRILRKYS